MTGNPDETIEWEVETDVVVAGYGFAGAVAAISARDSGAEVLLLEKSRHPGGNSIVSGGGFLLANDAGKAAHYLSQLCAGNTPDDVIRRMAEGFVELAGYIHGLARAVGAEAEFGELGKGIHYALPGCEALFYGKIAPTFAITGFPWVKGLRGGARLFKVLVDNLAKRGVEVRLSTAARRLVTDGRGAVIGLVAEHEGKPIPIKARRGVVLATGGFENSEQLRRQFLQALPIYPVCTLANTGDGILMAQKVGAALWHMWHIHGSYGFKFPEFPFGFRSTVRNRHFGAMAVPWILVDRRGRRFMNEYPRAVQDTAIRDLDHFDSELIAHPRIPCYAVFDDEARRLGPIAQVMINEEGYDYRWSEDNLAEVRRGWIIEAASLRELADRLDLDHSALAHTVGRWNEQCAMGADRDFDRPPGSMRPISTPPFYAVEVWPVITNTQGGPAHDVEQRIADAFGDPIPRLYAAGELGSMYGYLYPAAGNISECFIGGRIAGRNAAAEVPWGA